MALFFLDANVAARQIENVHLRWALDLPSLTNRRVPMQTYEDLGYAFETELE